MNVSTNFQNNPGSSQLNGANLNSKRHREEGAEDGVLPSSKIARVEQESTSLPILPKEVMLYIMQFLSPKDQVKIVVYRITDRDYSIDYKDIARFLQKIETFRWAAMHDIVPLMQAVETSTIKSSKYSLLWTIGRAGKKVALEMAIKNNASRAFEYLMIDLAGYGFPNCLYSDDVYEKDSILSEALSSSNQSIRKVVRECAPPAMKNRFFYW